MSQDADVIPGKHSEGYFKLNDAERRKAGIPRVDTHVYTRENGWAIEAFVALYNATGKAEYLQTAKTAAQWLLANRALAGGGYMHDANDRGGPFLGDTLAMGDACLALYQATQDYAWLERATLAAQFIDKNFKHADAGYVTAKVGDDASMRDVRIADENLTLTRFANLLNQQVGDAESKAMAAHAFRFLLSPAIIDRRMGGDLLLADLEVTRPAAHITVVGPKDDTAAAELYRAALAYPVAYKRLDWWDRREGPMRNSEISFPNLPKRVHSM